MDNIYNRHSISFTETMKCLYLTFTLEDGIFVFEDYIFTTEYHPLMWFFWLG
ncbi:glycoside hydrolase family 47 protein [Lentimicrobium sp. L6]|uniref:glycoside hydrolase family 47 protein n=1 Tax=Lentimicrobium sp. L6 TaxID=2735916 RepID=UPI003530365B